MFAIRTYSQPAHRHFASPAAAPIGAWLSEVARAYAANAPELNSNANAALETLTPRVSVEEHADAYEVRAELPGIAREHIKVAVEGKRLSIHTTLDPVAPNADEAPAPGKLIYSNRVRANYARSFTLPQAVNAEAVVAALENGVLSLRLPKLATPPTHHITIQ